MSWKVQTEIEEKDLSRKQFKRNNNEFAKFCRTNSSLNETMHLVTGKIQQFLKIPKPIKAVRKLSFNGLTL